MNLVIFDFCETICKYQSANRFVDFCLLKSDKKSFYYRCLSYLSSNIFIIKVLGRIFPKFNFCKRVKLFSLKGISQSKLNYFSKQYFEQLLINLNEDIVTILEKHVREGDHVLIVSGGYIEYLNNFKSYFKIKEVIATRIAFRNGKCNGLFEGKDCMFEEKINMTQCYLDSIELNYNKSICYTDSISDLSLLKWVDYPVVVSNMISQKWSNEYGFREIIINDKKTCNEKVNRKNEVFR